MPNEEMTVNINAETDDAGSNLMDLGALFGTLGATVASFAAGAVVSLGAFAVAVGIKAFNSANDLDSAVKNLAKTTGATIDETAEYKDTIIDLYNLNIGESFQDIADQMAEIRQQTGFSGEELKNFTKHAATFGKVFDKDIKETTRAANMLMDQFGISSDEAFNLMTQGAQQGLDKNDDMLDSLNEYSVHFKKLGFSAEDMFNIYKNGAEAGAFSIDFLGDATKEFAIATQEPTKEVGEAFKSLGFDVKDMNKIFAEGGPTAKRTMGAIISELANMEDKVKANEIGVTLFGTKWEDLGPEVTTELANISGGFDKSKDSAEGLRNVDYKTFGDAVKGIGRQIETGLLVPLGDLMLPILNKFGAALQEHLPIAIDLFKRIGSVVAEEFGPVIIQIMDDIRTAFKDVNLDSGQMKDFLMEVFSEVQRFVKELAITWKTEWDIITKDVLPNLINIVTMLAPIIGDAIIKGIQFLTWLSEKFRSTFNIIRSIVGPAMATLSIVIKEGMNIIKNIINLIMALIKGDWSAVWKSIKNIGRSAMNSIKAIIKNSINVVKKIFKVAWSVIKKIFRAAWAILKNIVKANIRIVVNVVRAGFNKMRSAIKSRLGSAKKIVKSLITSIKNTLKSAAKGAYNFGKNVLNAFGRGMKSRIKYLKNLARNAVSAIKRMLGFKSPTKEGPGRDAHKWAPNLMKMYAEGIYEKRKLLANVSKASAETLHNNLTMGPRISTMRQGVGNTINLNSTILNDQLASLVLQRVRRILTSGGVV